MNRAEKEKVVNLVHEKLEGAKAAILADFTGINVPSMGKFRRDCRTCEIEFIVVKNTILRRAVKDTGFDSLEQFLEGPTSIALSKEGPVKLAKTLVDFAKTDENLRVKVGVADGRLLEIEEIKKIASLPSREVLLSMLVSGFQSPYRGFVCALGGIISKFVNVLDEIRKKKES